MKSSVQLCLHGRSSQGQIKSRNKRRNKGTISRADLGVSISKVFVNFREGEIRAKICHFRGFFYFRSYSMTIIYFRQIFVVLPQDK